MKRSDVVKSALESLEYNWIQCVTDLHIVHSDLEESNPNEIEYDTVKKLFHLLDQKSLHFQQLESLKEKYSNYYNQYQKELQEEKEKDDAIMKEVMADDSIPNEKKYDVIIDAIMDYKFHEEDNDTVESSWINNYKEELQIKEEWIDKQAFDYSSVSFSEFDSEDETRKTVRNALTKYADLLYEFDRLVLFGCGEKTTLDEEEIDMDKADKIEAKYEMLKYFDNLCRFRDRVNRKKAMPIA